MRCPAGDLGIEGCLHTNVLIDFRLQLEFHEYHGAFLSGAMCDVHEMADAFECNAKVRKVMFIETLK